MVTALLLVLLLAPLYPLAYRVVKLAERRAEFLEAPQRAAGKAVADPIPPDLLAWSGGFDSEWAREQTLDRAYELYSKLGNWDHVRRVIANETREVTLTEVELTSGAPN